MIQTDPLFLGVVPRGARSYVVREIVRLDRPLINACTGRFSVVAAAIKDGVPPSQVQTSDIGLFSSVIGYLSDPSKSIEQLSIRILDPALEPKDVKDDLDFAAHIMLILKLNQMKQTNLRGLYGPAAWRETLRYEAEGVVLKADSEAWVAEARRLHDEIIAPMKLDGVIS